MGNGTEKIETSRSEDRFRPTREQSSATRGTAECEGTTTPAMKKELKVRDILTFLMNVIVVRTTAAEKTAEKTVGTTKAMTSVS